LDDAVSGELEGPLEDAPACLPEVALGDVDFDIDKEEFDTAITSKVQNR
jgi:hypothetical protein